MTRLEEQLRLQRMEIRLIEALVDAPRHVSAAREEQLRYALSLARLETFQPGAAREGERTTRRDVTVRSSELEAFRRLVLGRLARPLLHESSPRRRLDATVAAFGHFQSRLISTRDEVLANHVDDFSEDELDDEVGIKSLVGVGGGGGGAGYVYIGAYDVLQNEGIFPRYLTGSSIGAVLGLFRAKTRWADLDEYIALAHRLRPEELFRFISMKARYGFPGIFRLYLHDALGPTFRHPDGSTYTLADLAIPFEPIVAGIRRGAMRETRDEYERSHHLPGDRRPGPLELRAQFASQMVRTVAFVNPRMVKEIVLGADELTKDFDVIDAAGFSAAVPGILHYDVARKDFRMRAMLGELLRREDVVALIDGGVANNVPARTAWRRVRDGRIGTRNAYILAFDCFHPQVGVGHIAMHPLEAVIQLQVALNRRYWHRKISFTPTLSPISVLPSPQKLDRAISWGRAQMKTELPYVKKALEPVRFMREGFDLETPSGRVRRPTSIFPRF
jgi:predicted acylesterase/phospholipase RssA